MAISQYENSQIRKYIPQGKRYLFAIGIDKYQYCLGLVLLTIFVSSILLGWFNDAHIYLIYVLFETAGKA